jgi:hypothetical protein
MLRIKAKSVRNRWLMRSFFIAEPEYFSHHTPIHELIRGSFDVQATHRSTTGIASQ